jgi:hypothetical protein
LKEQSAEIIQLTAEPSNEAKVDQKPTFAKLVLLHDTKKSDDSLQAVLTRLKDKILVKAKNDLLLKPPESAKKVERPFYVDVKANVYTLLEDDGKTADAPYNATVALITPQSEFNYSLFKAELTDTDKEVDNFVNTFIARLSTEDLVENYWTDRSKFARLSKLLLKTAASNFWIKTLGFDPLVDSFYLDIKREEKEPKVKYKKRRLQHMRIPIKRNDTLLRESITDMLTHPLNKAHANALVHILNTVCEKTTLEHFASKYIASNESLIPSVEQLRRLGRIPDIRIKEFKNLFHSREWVEIQNSALFINEAKLKTLVKTKLKAENVRTFLNDIRDLERIIKEDAFSSVILDVKRQRLAKAAVWKRKSDSDEDTLQVLAFAKKRIRDDTNLEVFSPNKILVATGKYGGLSELRACIQYSAKDHTWTIGDTYARLPDSQKVVVDEFILWLNSA